ncbi:energy transducer TonB [Henriciella sp.]|uniref:energy transducer TonB n=1 Tax=Henriciella sp. TaxID=1968823 RepID=UPI00261CCC21|nr:energy transducer TonB [Henriciella sp.]
MKLVHVTAFAGLTLGLSACAVDPAVYGPGPQAGPAVPSQTDTAAMSAALDGKIEACGHAGAEEARLIYPGGWHQRLSERPESSQSGGELLGGPVTREVVDRDAQPLSPPQPRYPEQAANRGIEAKCEILMDVSEAGQPEDVLTACSSPQFNASAYEAASRLRFAPETVDGRAVRRINVVYPITYCLNESGRAAGAYERY